MATREIDFGDIPPFDPNSPEADFIPPSEPNLPSRNIYPDSLVDAFRWGVENPPGISRGLIRDPRKLAELLYFRAPNGWIHFLTSTGTPEQLAAALKTQRPINIHWISQRPVADLTNPAFTFDVTDARSSLPPFIRKRNRWKHFWGGGDNYELSKLDPKRIINSLDESSKAEFINYATRLWGVSTVEELYELVFEWFKGNVGLDSAVARAQLPIIRALGEKKLSPKERTRLIRSGVVITDNPLTLYTAVKFGTNAVYLHDLKALPKVKRLIAPLSYPSDKVE